MKISQILVVTIMCVFAAGNAVANDITIETPRGKFSIAAVPEKFIVMDVSAIDTLDALGLKPSGIVSNIFVDYLGDIQATSKIIGTLHEPDFEAIFEMKPDLVIVGGRSSRKYDAMTKIAPTIDMTIWGEDIVGQAKQRLEAYGQLFAKQQEAAKIAAQFDAKIEETRKAAIGKGNALILLTNGPKISVYGSKGRFGWLHHTLNIPEAASNVEDTTHGEAVSFEFIRDTDPDWLIVIDRIAAIGQNGAAARETLDNVLIHDMKVWKTNQIIYINAANIYIAGGGIQSMSKIMDEIIAAFTQTH